MEEMVGKRFGKLVIIEFEKRSPNVLSRCTCRCDCGNTIEIGLAALRKKTSCGCDYLDPRVDITGKKYGKLTVESRVIESNVEAFAMKWKCRCDCGKEITATTLALQAGLIVSCGCTAAEEVTLDLANVNRGNIEKTNTHILQGALDGVMYENNKSGVRGVYFSNTYKNYWANIVFQGKRYNLGRYKTIEEAQKAREKAEEILYVSFLEHYEEDLKPQIEAENERANIEGFESFVENLEPDKERTPFFTPGKYEEGLCQVCGKPVPKGRQKYCSNACCSRALQEFNYHKRKRTDEKFCPVCGKPVPSNRTKYCSDSCRGLALKRKSVRTGDAHQKQIVCPDCGKLAWVGNSSVRCKECQAEVRKRQNAESHLRKKEGTTRKIGSEASCERCGRPYIVKGATQKYCENCAGIMIQEKARKRYVPKEAATLICHICGKEFTSTASRKPKYCSDECREEGLRRYYKEVWKRQKAEKEKEKK